MDQLRQDLIDLMLIPGLSGHETRVAVAIRSKLSVHAIPTRTDRLGNVIARFDGSSNATNKTKPHTLNMMPAACGITNSGS